MLSINTNLPSLIAQNSLKNSTLKLNTAIERMTTGFKINSAKDNAANYSIATNMTTKINAYQVAEENTAMGLDLINTANDSLDLISDKLTRLRALAEQAANGTYGKQSLAAINAEAKALVDEIERSQANTAYNGIELFGKKAGSFIAEIQQRDTSGMTKLAEIDETSAISGGTYSISSAQELAKLATMTNNGKIGANCEFVLANNIDLSAYTSGEGWVPIGLESSKFKATFDGNGYVISNLKISRPTTHYQGLFGAIENAEIKNTGLNNVDVEGMHYTGALISRSFDGSTITNCYVENGKGIKSNGSNAGGIIACTSGNNINISNCYTTIDIIADDHNGGGLIGSNNAKNGTITNCYATGDITGIKGTLGGLIGSNKMGGTISNCFATGNISSGTGALNLNGGLIASCGKGRTSDLTIKNCYSTGNVSNYASAAGGFIGTILKASDTTTTTIENCYSTGKVIGDNVAGGFITEAGTPNLTIVNCYATGDISSINGYASGFIRYFSGGTIASSYFKGNVETQNAYSAGFIGCINSDSIITNCYAEGKITTNKNYCGGLIGGFSSATSSSISNCYSNVEINTTFGDLSTTGGLIGYANGAAVVNSYYNTEISKQNDTGKGTGVTTEELKSLIANGTLSNSQAKVEEFNYDLITYYQPVSINLQVGIDSSDSSQINLNSNIGGVKLQSLRNIGLKNIDYLSIIDETAAKYNSIQTNYGAVQNRLESVLDEISTKYDNLVSSRSTLRDADIAEVSSEYIRQQILQQASATLLSTANQTPALALQLL